MVETGCLQRRSYLCDDPHGQGFVDTPEVFYANKVIHLLLDTDRAQLSSSRRGACALGIKGELLTVTSLPLPAAMTFHQLRLRNPMATQDAGPKSHPQRVTGRVRGAVRLLRPCRFLDHLCPPQSCASTASCRDSGLPFEGPRSLGVTSARRFGL